MRNESIGAGSTFVFDERTRQLHSQSINCVKAIIVSLSYFPSQKFREELATVYVVNKLSFWYRNHLCMWESNITRTPRFHGLKALYSPPKIILEHSCYSLFTSPLICSNAWHTEPKGTWFYNYCVALWRKLVNLWETACTLLLIIFPHRHRQHSEHHSRPHIYFQEYNKRCCHHLLAPSQGGPQ